MTRLKDKWILNFVYSCPYEETLLKIAKKSTTLQYHKEGQKKAEIVQKLWNIYEKKIFRMFKYFYKINIFEKSIKADTSLIAPNSFSNPLTISLKHWPDIEVSAKSKRGFLYSVIHELAHYFSYTRGEKTYFNKLLAKTQKINILSDRGANLHYLIQAVEFGIIGEIFGVKYAEYSRNWIIKNWESNQYGKSASLLKKQKVPLDKSCLGYIEKLLTFHPPGGTDSPHFINR